MSTLLPHQEQGTQMKEESSYHSVLQQFQDYNQARIQLEFKMGQEGQKLAQKYNDHRFKLAKKHEKKQARMTQEGNATFQEVFSMVSLADLIKLLPWHVSSAVPFCYVGEALATTVQQGENVQSTTAAPQPEGSLAPGPLSSPAHPTGTLPPLMPLLPDIPFVGTPVV